VTDHFRVQGPRFDGAEGLPGLITVGFKGQDLTGPRALGWNQEVEIERVKDVSEERCPSLQPKPWTNKSKEGKRGSKVSPRSRRGPVLQSLSTARSSG
jgi:hypothetical protein